MSDFKRFRRKDVVEAMPYTGSLGALVTVPSGHKPVFGDVIAQDPNEPTRQWLVPAAEFAANYEPAPEAQQPTQESAEEHGSN